ncbi:hypothetical protein [Streptomyces sp. NPDC047718]|uniref:hypothetical protein n=1 Tax=Streptomyces sp. NPDC047718 TaxID=3155479 RepID=UPI0033C3FF70
MARRSIRTKLAAAAATGALALGAGLLAAGPGPGGLVGLPLGYVCIYATTSENSVQCGPGECPRGRFR